MNAHRFFPLLITSLLLSALPVRAQEGADAQVILDDKAPVVDQEAVEAGPAFFPIPQYSGDLMTREALTGDWGGVRSTLAEDSGVQFSAGVTNYFLGVWDGGNSSGSEYNGSSDYRVMIDTEKAWGSPGGFLEIHGETYWGQSVNGSTGAILPVNIDPVLALPGGPGTYLSHVVYTQFLSEKFAVFMGKLDTTNGDANRAAHGVGDRRFMNLGFSFNAVSLLAAPYSTLGAGFILLPAEGVSFSFTAMDTDGLITRSGFDTVFNGNTSYSAELAIDSNFFEQSGRHTFGFLGSSKEFASTLQDPRLLIPGAGIVPSIEDGTWAFTYNVDQYLVSDPDDPNQGWLLFGRFGVSDGEANYIHRFYSGGIGGVGVIPGRDRDRFGIGYYYLELTDNRLGLFTDDDEHGVEIFYNIAVTPWFELTPDLQIIDGAGRFSDTAVVGGLRGRIAF